MLAVARVSGTRLVNKTIRLHYAGLGWYQAIKHEINVYNLLLTARQPMAIDGVLVIVQWTVGNEVMHRINSNGAS